MHKGVFGHSPSWWRRERWKSVLIKNIPPRASLEVWAGSVPLPRVHRLHLLFCRLPTPYLGLMLSGNSWTKAKQCSLFHCIEKTQPRKTELNLTASWSMEAICDKDGCLSKIRKQNWSILYINGFGQWIILQHPRCWIVAITKKIVIMIVTVINTVGPFCCSWLEGPQPHPRH